MGEKVLRVYRNYYKRHMDKQGGVCGNEGRRWGWLGSGGVVGSKSRKIYLYNNKIQKYLI